MQYICTVLGTKNIFHMQSNKAIRKGKIYGRHRKMPAHRNGGRDVAWLTVAGIWLEQAGFNVGDVIEIEVAAGQLVIKKQPDGDR